MSEIYDVLVIGAGPAGCSAALYTTRAGLSTIVLDKMSYGGQMQEASVFENYPGFPDGISGAELSDKMKEQAERFGAVFKNANVKELDLSGDVKTAVLAKEEIKAKAVIIAAGSKYKHLGVDGENELIGRGIGFCASCDGMFYRKKKVVVVGGGNTALAEAMILANICDKVYIVHRRDAFRGEKVTAEKLIAMENVKVIWNSTVDGYISDEVIKGVRLKNVKTGELTEIECSGIFISIGRDPETELVKGTVKLDDSGYIITDNAMKTNIAGVYAAGDIRSGAFRQVITAAGDGAMAAHSAIEYLQ